MLNLLEDVSESSSLLKQRGEEKQASGEELKKPTGGSDEHEQKPNPNDPKGNEASGSKGKGKLIDDDDEEEDLLEEDQLKKKET